MSKKTAENDSIAWGDKLVTALAYVKGTNYIGAKNVNKLVPDWGREGGLTIKQLKIRKEKNWQIWADRFVVMFCIGMLALVLGIYFQLPLPGMLMLFAAPFGLFAAVKGLLRLKKSKPEPISYKVKFWIWFALAVVTAIGAYFLLGMLSHVVTPLYAPIITLVGIISGATMVAGGTAIMALAPLGILGIAIYLGYPLIKSLQKDIQERWKKGNNAIWKKGGLLGLITLIAITLLVLFSLSILAPASLPAFFTSVEMYFLMGPALVEIFFMGKTAWAGYEAWIGEGKILAKFFKVDAVKEEFISSKPGEEGSLDLNQAAKQTNAEITKLSTSVSDVAGHETKQDAPGPGKWGYKEISRSMPPSKNHADGGENKEFKEEVAQSAVIEGDNKEKSVDLTDPNLPLPLLAMYDNLPQQNEKAADVVSTP